MAPDTTIKLILLTVLTAVFASAQGVVRVATLDDLRKIGSSEAYPLYGDYELVCDIDASDSRRRPFVPIGGNGRPFTGRFFSRGGAVYVIRDLYINRPASGHVGLFGVVGYDAEVSNVGVAADTIIGSYAVGALAGSNNGTIVNCYGTGTVLARRNESDVGGLVGVNSGGIYESYSAAEVQGRDNVGGLVGLLRISAAGEIRQCFALGRVVGASNVGGLVGQVFGGRVRESFSAGRVSGGGTAGGLIGLDFASTPLWSDRGVFIDKEGDAVYVRPAEVSGSFWDTEASGQGASAGGEGRSGVQMRSRNTFAGWDFGGVWAIEEGFGYPQLIRAPYTTRKLAYAVDGEFCGRLKINGPQGTVELYRYGVEAVPGSAGPKVTAEAWEGCRFVGWSDGALGTVRVDTVRGDAKFTAKFDRSGGPALRKYRYVAWAGGSLTASGVSGYVSIIDTSVAGIGAFVVAAAPERGYRFASWSDGFEGVVRADAVPPNAPPAARFAEAGTGGEAVEVSRYADLFLIGKYVTHPLDGIYELTCDIAIPATGRFEPIGSESAPFTGVFRGNGYKISGIDMGRGGNVGDFTGLFGYAEGADIRDLFVEGSVAGIDNAGMLAGMCVNTVIEGCGAAGSVRGRSGVGGLVGRSAASLISRSYSTASVAGSGQEVGGLVGGASESFLTRSYASGSVIGASYVGGAVGWGSGGYVQDCHALGNVSGEGAAGGFICRTGGGIGVLRAYSAGLVIGAGLGSGGFSGTLGGGSGGSAGGAVSINGCYWDAERSGMDVSVGGIGKSAAEMRLKSTYAGWDFDGVWEMTEGDYPRLSGFARDSIQEAFFEQWRVSTPAARNNAKPLVRVSGRAVYVNARPGAPVRINLIDMRGKTVARYDVAGTKKLSLDKLASGRYIVEARLRGRREFVSPVRIFK
ncbi:MAG: hypothetical protein LBC59_05480 [Chitinispirillales bacterium]|jgi:hypothetical protein|nr:hypothetical protein [Chitinispirillales bacterium]